MVEFELIERYCHGIGSQHQETTLSVGDDAALIKVPTGFEVAISVDTMVSGIHFFADVSPARLAHKLMAVNVSDMAAMGAQAKWATLALTVPETDECWLREFMQSLHLQAKHNDVQLIGGDSTQGPLSMTLQIMGLVPTGQALTRNGAKIGDDVYVSGELGDAALALRLMQGRENSVPTELLDKLEKPQAQLALGQALLNHASACVDVSDGLVADLAHIAKASGVSLALDLDCLPLSDIFKEYLEQGFDLELAFAGGDDYQLAFCVDIKHRPYMQKLNSTLGIRLTRIGEVVSQDQRAVHLIKEGEAYDFENKQGYQHFSGN